jgi:hypothetical protein
VTDLQAIRISVNLHTRIVVGLVDSVERAETPKQKAERLYLIRDEVIEFRREFNEFIAKQLTNQPENTVL